MFKDETDHVRTRVCTGKIGQPSSKSRVSVSQPTPTLQAPSTSVEHQARCFFVKNYVWADSDSARGHLDHVPGLFGACGNDTLVVTLTAVGMAALANLKSDPGMMAAARQNYVTALHLTNAALQDTVGVRTDQTLTAVILLGIFEVHNLLFCDACQTACFLTVTQTLTCKTHKSMQSWTNHILGATALLKLRGVEQLQNKTGLRLFQMLRAQTVSAPDLFQI